MRKYHCFLFIGLISVIHCQQDSFDCQEQTECPPSPKAPPPPILKQNLPMLFQPAKFAKRLDNGMSRDYPGSILTRDINEDKHPDILELSFAHLDSGKRISLFLWDENNKQFGIPVQIPLSIKGITQFLEAADFNQDGHIDLAVLSTAELQILTGDGTGRFSYWKSIAAGPIGIPWYFSLGHFGKATTQALDFIIFTYNPNAKEDQILISIITQDGKGNYGTPILKYGPKGLPYQRSVGDVNKDGISDIIVLTIDSNAFLFMGDGMGGLLNPTTIPLLDKPYALSLGPWYDPTQIDLGLITDKKFQILSGDGSGGFSAPAFTVTLPQNIYPLSLQLLHLNQDKETDIIFPEYISGDICAFYGQGVSSIQLKKCISTGSFSSIFDVVDLNADRNLDIVVANESATYSVIYQNTQGDGFQEAKNFGLTASTLQAIASGTFQGGIGQELAILDAESKRVIIWPSSDDKLIIPDNFYRAFEAFTHKISIEQGIMITGQLNPKQDTQEDIVIAEQSVGKQHLQIHMSIRLPYGQYDLKKKTSYPLVRTPIAMAIDDINADQNPDIFVLNETGFTLFSGQKDGTFTTQEINVPEMYQPSALSIKDIDNDGKQDILVTNSGNQNLLLFLSKDGTKTSLFDKPIVLSTPFAASAFAIADLNQDHFLDIAVIYPKQKQVDVLLQQTNGSFVSKSWSVDHEPNAIVIADINIDQTLDVLVSHKGQNSLTLLAGKGNGSFFEQKQTISVGEEPIAMIAKDFDQDGKLDLAIINQKSRTVSLLYNQTTSYSFTKQ